MSQSILSYIRGLLSVSEPANCISLARVAKGISHDRLSRILNNTKLEWKTLLQAAILRIAGKLQGGYLILDDTVINKSFAKKIENLSWIFCSKENRAVLGLNVVVLCWSNGTITLPLAIKFWKKQEEKSKYELACELLAYAKNILCLQPEYVVFDSWYASEKILSAIHSYGWIFFSQLKKNRKLNGIQIQKLYRHPYWMKKGKICGCDKALVIKHGKKYFVTNNPSLSRKEILAFYKTRWVIETMFRILYSELGLEECQSLSLQAQRAHAHLSLMALVMLEKMKEKTGKTHYELRREYRFHPELVENLFVDWGLVGA